MSGEAITILVSEGNSFVRKALVALVDLMAGLRVVGEAGDGWETIAQFRRLSPAITLIDLQLPRLSAVEVIQHIRSWAPEAQFIILSTYDDETNIARALRAGAQGCILKGMTADELVATIRRVHARSSALAHSEA